MSLGKRSGRRVYTGRVLNLDVDVVEFPDGTLGELEIFRHPGASAVVPFLTDPRGEDPQILLIKQYRYAAGDYMYEIPAGRLDPGEDPAACAHRELREETGCSAASMEHLYTIYTTPGFTDEKIHIFLASDLTQGDAAREADEFLTVEPVKLSRALELVKSGELKDSKTAVGILYAAGFVSGM